MARPDIRHAQPSPQDTGFGRFGADVAANLQSWADLRLGVEIGSVLRPVSEMTDVPDPSNYVSMLYALPYRGDRVQTVRHQTLFVLPKVHGFDLVSAGPKRSAAEDTMTAQIENEEFAATFAELVEPSDQPLQIFDWVAAPGERPLVAFLRHTDTLSIDSGTIFIHLGDQEKIRTLQTTVDMAVRRREMDDIHQLDINDHALETIIGAEVFGTLADYRFGDPGSERRAG